jgi:CO/xanthine dehydrogenase FAD-binding subunit
MHAGRSGHLLGGNLVNASPAADSAPVLLVLDSTVVLAGKDASERVEPLEGFFKGPGHTIMNPGEILSEIRIPVPEDKLKMCFLKMGQRNAMAISVVNVAVCLKASQKGVIRKARIALGSVAPTPIRATRSEEFLTGKDPSPETLEKAADLVWEEISPISDIRAGREYRLEMARELVKRALFGAMKSDSGVVNNG